MTTKTFTMQYMCAAFEELSPEDSALVEAAKKACATAYAPYSNFHVGAAVALENGVVVSGSNQENAAYPSGTCAERCALFYANATHPTVAVRALAIAAADADGAFTVAPVAPCGACRQVLLEAEQRFGKPIRILLYGAQQVVIVESALSLLPLQFDAELLKN